MSDETPLRWLYTGFPTEPGHYVVMEPYRRAKVLWWSPNSRDWRDGPYLVRAHCFMGPLPTPKKGEFD